MNKTLFLNQPISPILISIGSQAISDKVQITKWSFSHTIWVQKILFIPRWTLVQKKIKILTKKWWKRSFYLLHQKFLPKTRWFKRTKQEISIIIQQILYQAPTNLNSRILVWPATWPRCTEEAHTFVTLKTMTANSPYWKELCQRLCKLSRNNKIQGLQLLYKAIMNIKCLSNQGSSKRQISSKNKRRSRFCKWLKMQHNSYALLTVGSIPR